MTEEALHLIPDFSGYYIDRQGVIYDANGPVQTWLDTDTDEVCVDLQTHDGSYLGPAWRLVLRTFYGGNREGLFPDYLDGDMNNLSVDNLEFLIRDAKDGDWRPVAWTMRGLVRYVDRRAKQKVMVIETGEVYNTVAEAARAINGQTSNIYACLAGRLKSHKNFTFKYV